MIILKNLKSIGVIPLLKFTHILILPLFQKFFNFSKIYKKFKKRRNSELHVPLFCAFFFYTGVSPFSFSIARCFLLVNIFLYKKGLLPKKKSLNFVVLECANCLILRVAIEGCIAGACIGQSPNKSDA